MKAGGTNKMVTAVYCASCGQKTTVPFRPTQGRPVLCRACYMGQRNVASA
jgi:CxxC-x17-CxxC domain-containing protein